MANLRIDSGEFAMGAELLSKFTGEKKCSYLLFPSRCAQKGKATSELPWFLAAFVEAKCQSYFVSGQIKLTHPGSLQIDLPWRQIV
jgi:hypothetical protein